MFRAARGRAARPHRRPLAEKTPAVSPTELNCLRSTTNPAPILHQWFRASRTPLRCMPCNSFNVVDSETRARIRSGLSRLSLAMWHCVSTEVRDMASDKAVPAHLPSPSPGAAQPCRSETRLPPGALRDVLQIRCTGPIDFIRWQYILRNKSSKASGPEYVLTFLS